MKKRRTWASYQDEKAISEANAKKAMEQDHITEELKKHGNIKEAAAVFSHEGFNLLLDGISGYVAKRLEPELERILDKKLGELLEGLKEGAQQALSELQAAATVEPESDPEPVKKPEAKLSLIDIALMNAREIDGKQPQKKEYIPRVSPVNPLPPNEPKGTGKDWTTEEDIYLADTVLRYVSTGKTQTDAFKEVAKRLNRTEAATGYRWNAALRKQYVDRLEKAKEIGRKYRYGKVQ